MGRRPPDITYARIDADPLRSEREVSNAQLTRVNSLCGISLRQKLSEEYQRMMDRATYSKGASGVGELSETGAVSNGCKDQSSQEWRIDQGLEQLEIDNSYSSRLK